MIKVKIQNPKLGRNEVTFRPLLYMANNLLDYSIEITDSDTYDFLFVGMHDFIDKKRTLQESIDYGLENLSKITGDYFLFDGSDSTSLMGAYEIFENSNAIYLFKNQILNNRLSYKNPSAFNKWFFGTGSNLDLSYDIPPHIWDRIKLSNINCGRTILGYGLPTNIDHMPNINKNKHLDICAIFQAEHPYCEDHKVRNDLVYTKHRKKSWDILQTMKSKYSMITDQLPMEIYLKNLSESKICISPFGQGEICFRDFEAMYMGTILLKPNQQDVLTSPNMYIENETYIPCKHDWSDLEEKIDYILSNFNEVNDKLTYNIRKMYTEEYTIDKFCMHYYEMFSNLPNIKAH